MRASFPTRLAVIAASAWVAPAFAAVLETATYNFDLDVDIDASPNGSDWSQATAHFDGFDTTLGTLTGVSVELFSSYGASIEVQGDNQSPESSLDLQADYHGTLRHEFTNPALGQSGHYSESPYVNATCSSGFGQCYGQGWDTRAPINSAEVDALLLAYFLGPLDLTIRHDGSLSTFTQNYFGGFGTSRVHANWNGIVWLRYEYTPADAAPVPLPGTLPMLLTGAGLLGLLRRRPAGTQAVS